jgi:type II secretory pathway pseudopilin PulG
LLELLVTLCVMGLLSAAGAAVLGGGEGRQMQRTASSVSALLKAAKRNAQKSGALQRVEINAKTVTAANLNWTVKRPGHADFRLVKTNSRGLNTGAIIFYPDGSSNGGVIEMVAADVTQKIEVDSLGRVDVPK